MILQFERLVAAPAERVYAALTEGRHLARWFCDDAASDAVEGGRLVMKWRRPESTLEPFEGKWLELVPARRCVYAGGHRGYPDGYAGKIELEIESASGGTLLRVRHEMPDQVEYAPFAGAYAGAWPRALDRLAAYLAPAGG